MTLTEILVLKFTSKTTTTMSAQQPSYYSILTAHVRYSTKISSLAKLLYSEITALSSSSGYCYASNTYFATNYSCSIDTVSRCIKELENAGFVRIEIRPDLGNRRYIWAIDTKTEVSAILQEPIRKNADTYPQKRGEGIRKNADNNIIYNTTSNNTSNNEKETSAFAPSFSENDSVVKDYFTTDIEEKKEKKEPSIGRGAVTTEMPKVLQVVEYMNTIAGTKYRANTGNTAKMILARYKDGYTMDEIKKVISTQYAKWKGTDMMQHFNPVTLFRPNNFEKYLNSANFGAAKQTAAQINGGSDYTNWDESNKPF